MAPKAAPMLPPAAQAEGAYDLKSLAALVLSGFTLRSFVSVMEGPLGNWLYPVLMWQSGITQVLHGPQVPESPNFLPDLPLPKELEPGCQPLKSHATPEDALACALNDGFLPDLEFRSRATPWRASVRDYLHAYKSGACTPTQAMERIVAFLRAGEADKAQPRAWMAAWSEDEVMRQARESTERYKEGKARPLEGVPFAIKDVADALPYPTTAGTSFLASRRQVKASAPAVVALQRMGAILLGKSNMHEIGLGVTGLNLRLGTPLNPWGWPGTRHFTGGSSSGSGALVGAGVCPFSIGTDGGGSIRIPAAFCGCVGLKPTTGRVTGRGGVEIDCTVATYGPLGGSVEDTALLYAVMANQDQWVTLHDDPLPAPQLPHPLPRAATAAKGEELPLSGIKLGVFWQWFQDCDPEVLQCCQAAVEAAVAQGASLVEVTVPELEAMRVAHTVTIVSEMHHQMQPYLDDPTTRVAFNPDVRLNLDVARKWTGADYITAQRIRARASEHFRRALRDAHVLVTPTIACSAPSISAAVYRGGSSDLGQTSKVMRFVSQANLTGLPAISVPVGCDSENLPIGLQFIGRPWAEATLLRTASVLESATAPQFKDCLPAVYINPLTGRSAGL